jgi:hypothetical protein
VLADFEAGLTASTLWARFDPNRWPGAAEPLHRDQAGQNNGTWQFCEEGIMGYATLPAPFAPAPGSLSVRI